MRSYPYTILNSLDEVVSRHSSPSRAIRALRRLGPGASIDSRTRWAFEALYLAMTGEFPPKSLLQSDQAA
jgi:hypothetical protein